MQHRPRSLVVATAAAFAVLASACGSSDTAAAPDPTVSSTPAAASGGTAVDDPGVTARIDDGVLEVLDADGATVASVAPSDEEGEAVHAAVRPGDDDDVAVVALFRVDHAELPARYELRYLVVDGESASELYWFPNRMQVDARVAEVADVAPVPVWSPDGSTLAWLEWDGQDVVLRLVGWIHEETSSNPADRAASYTVSDVVAGTQLDAWIDGETTVFQATAPDGEDVEIELDLSTLAAPRRDI